MAHIREPIYNFLPTFAAALQWISATTGSTECPRSETPTGAPGEIKSKID